MDIRNLSIRIRLPCSSVGRGALHGLAFENFLNGLHVSGERGTPVSCSDYLAFRLSWLFFAGTTYVADAVYCRITTFRNNATASHARCAFALGNST
jgi:hypothetical protein